MARIILDSFKMDDFGDDLYGDPGNYQEPEVLDLVHLSQMSKVEQKVLRKLIDLYFASHGNTPRRHEAEVQLRANGMFISRDAYETKRKLNALTQ